MTPSTFIFCLCSNLTEEQQGGVGGINFDSWCSDDASLDSSQRSCGFGTAAELQASADSAFLQVGGEV